MLRSVLFFLYTELNMFIISFFTLPARDLKLIIDMMESYNKPTMRQRKLHAIRNYLDVVIFINVC